MNCIITVIRPGVDVTIINSTRRDVLSKLLTRFLWTVVGRLGDVDVNNSIMFIQTGSRLVDEVVNQPFRLRFGQQVLDLLCGVEFIEESVWAQMSAACGAQTAS